MKACIVSLLALVLCAFSVSHSAVGFVCQQCSDPEPPCDLRSGPDQRPGPCSPIILDVSGDGFDLTSATGGVLFDISGTGNPVQIAWTAQGTNNGFLALPGADGLVDNGKQLFGNFTPQPTSNNPNGFAALAVYDLPANGGNGDGIIDSRDAIYSSLRLWIDANHDGISQPEELHTLQSEGVVAISLNYTLSKKVVCASRGKTAITFSHRQWQNHPAYRTASLALAAHSFLCLLLGEPRLFNFVYTTPNFFHFLKMI